jgi:hypothetical protein
MEIVKNECQELIQGKEGTITGLKDTGNGCLEKKGNAYSLQIF